MAFFIFIPFSDTISFLRPQSDHRIHFPKNATGRVTPVAVRQNQLWVAKEPRLLSRYSLSLLVFTGRNGTPTMPTPQWPYPKLCLAKLQPFESEMVVYFHE